MKATDCTKCDGWGCRSCLKLGGEQSPSVDELREERMKGRVTELERGLGDLEILVSHVHTVRRRFASGAADAAEVGIATQQVFDAIRKLARP